MVSQVVTNSSEKSQLFSRVGYPIYAQPDRYGAMDIDHLHDFFVSSVDPYLKSKSSELFVLDFSLIKFWDISALLWLLIALHYYKLEGLNYRLRLPEPREEMSEEDREKFQKSADFLRRWEFAEGLKNITLNYVSLLVPDQTSYFDIEPKHYPPAQIQIKHEITETLLSKSLAPIRNLVDFESTGIKKITNAEISKCISDFQTARIGDILERQCGLDKRKADLFSDHLLTEGLVNVKEHPNASIGMIATSVLGKSGELILAMVDNGDAISRTIYKTFLDSDLPSTEDKKEFPEEYERVSLSIKQRSYLTNFATLPGISRKERAHISETDSRIDDKQYQVGMGLHYIRKDIVETFEGSFKIVSGGVSVNFFKTDNSFVYKKCDYKWRGNLLRISIPILTT